MSWKIAAHIPVDELITLTDPHTAPELLPPAFRKPDNSRKLTYCRKALRQAVRRCLTPMQQRNIALYYGRRMCMSEIAKQQNVTCSAVSKSLRSGQAQIRKYVETYMDIYNALEKELMRDGLL